MYLKSIKIGNRVEIYQNPGKPEGKSHLSQVEDILSENEFLIHVPIAYGQLVRLPIGKKLGFIFFTEKAMVIFSGEILQFRKEGELNFMVIKLLSEGEKIQRRAFFRFNCLLPLKYYYNPSGNIDFEQADICRDGIIKDIGGGGIRFVSNEDIDEFEEIKCNIMLDDEYLSLRGTILSKAYFPKSNYKYQYRLEFRSATADEQESIVKFIFNEERKLMKKNRN